MVTHLRNETAMFGCVRATIRRSTIIRSYWSERDHSNSFAWAFGNILDASHTPFMNCIRDYMPVIAEEKYIRHITMVTDHACTDTLMPESYFNSVVQICGVSP